MRSEALCGGDVMSWDCNRHLGVTDPSPMGWAAGKGLTGVRRQPMAPWARITSCFSLPPALGLPEPRRGGGPASLRPIGSGHPVG
ncbi:hypothetical protein NDU88_002625 [Pleurodeles waltl]|uniref:Uncharacterized protein n=1 Tax=Pleurodeles waltl TaxID=8319 RepID=A0AAV7VD18_PLEWA|nr:hypothetical protein NDU88_002625 [Pleurodeles waltl]